MSIGIEILRAIKTADSLQQRLGAERLKSYFDRLVAGGFKDVEDQPQPESVFDHSAFTYYPKRSLLIFKKDNREVHLTRREHETFMKLAQNIERVVSHDELYVPQLRWYIQNLRRKLEPGTRRNFRYVISVRGKGYMLSDPDRDLDIKPSESVFDSDTHFQLHSI